MPVPLRLDPETGCLLLRDTRLMPLHGRSDALAQMKGLSLSFPFGHAQTALLATNIGGEDAYLALHFRDEALAEATLQIGSGWRTGDEARRQLHRVDEVLLREFGVEIRDGIAQFPWGAVYNFIGRGGGARLGVKYGTDALRAVADMM